MSKETIDIDFTAGDTGSVLRVTIRDKYTKALIPLDGVYTATLLFKPAGGLLVARAMTILTGTDDGKAEYQFTTAELVVGQMETQVQLTHTASSKVISSLGIRCYRVGAKLT